MKWFIALLCCLAIPMAAHAADDQGGKKKKGQQGQQQHTQKVHAQQPKMGGGGKGGKHLGQGQGGDQTVHQGKVHKGKGDQHEQGMAGGQDKLNKGKNKNLAEGQGKITKEGKFHTKQFKFANNPNPKIQNIKFQANHHIEGSEHWQGQKYVIFKNYHSEWHDRFWWHQHYPRVVLVFGGWYYWNQGYWFPAWGYDPGQSYYAYDGPIYAHRDLSPDQVVANVQSALQEQGYYKGEVDGLLGPQTRDALSDYQRDKGLATTAAVDEPTLESLDLS